MEVVSLLTTISSPFVWSMGFNINSLVHIPLSRMVLLRGNTGRLLRVDYLCFTTLIFLFPIAYMPLVLQFILLIEFPLLFWILSHLGKSCMITNHLFMPWKPLVVPVTLSWSLTILINLILSLDSASSLVILHNPRVIFAWLLS